MKTQIEIELYRCEVCGHEWLPRLIKKGRRVGYQRPKRCAACKTPYWDRRSNGETCRDTKAR